MNIQEINTAIITGTFTNDQLTSITDAVKYNRSLIARKNLFSIRAGALVKFTDARNGRIFTGTVTKVAVKNISVDVGTMTYRVPANMISLA
jgi:hypothetical protein